MFELIQPNNIEKCVYKFIPNKRKIFIMTKMTSVINYIFYILYNAQGIILYESLRNWKFLVCERCAYSEGLQREAGEISDVVCVCVYRDPGREWKRDAAIRDKTWDSLKGKALFFLVL